MKQFCMKIYLISQGRENVLFLPSKMAEMTSHENALYGDLVPLIYADFSVDYDGDNVLGKGDLKHTLQAVTSNELNNNEIEFVVGKVSSFC